MKRYEIMALALFDWSCFTSQFFSCPSFYETTNRLSKETFVDRRPSFTQVEVRSRDGANLGPGNGLPSVLWLETWAKPNVNPNIIKTHDRYRVSSNYFLARIIHSTYDIFFNPALYSIEARRRILTPTSAPKMPEETNPDTSRYWSEIMASRLYFGEDWWT